MSEDESKDSDGPDEIAAISTLIKVLEPLSRDARERVLAFVFSKLKLPLRGSNQPLGIAPPSSEGNAEQRGGTRAVDIRSLVAEKRPSSAVEMACIVAYYVSHLAPANERQDTINVSDLERYFKQGGYPLPKVARFTLTNAKEAGYLDPAARGAYRLTTVGYNLVAHRMPTGTAK